MNDALPRVVTFDGEARSGKGTIVQLTKDYLRDQLGLKAMLIDRGQTFRVLVVAAARANISVDNPAAIDAFLTNDQHLANCTQLVKDVYHMEKPERDALLYTNTVSENSAKIGARAASQDFVRRLTKKWLHDAGQEGYEVVLIDGRALEHIAREMHDEGLCDFRLGLYFICDSQMGARRTLGLATRPYEQLSVAERRVVDDFMVQITERNQRDFARSSEPLVRPDAATLWRLPDPAPELPAGACPQLIVDTSADMTKKAMSQPVAELVGRYVEA
ncbi:hypothetical protein CR983_00860 [Candidatus Saccharibacteria bacterium]|nr:MAG: hypothetical protein CR983_00860 [Candidatus Saccharibacteria bacterium]